MKIVHCQQNMPFELGSSQIGFERLFVSVFVKSKVTIYQPLHSYTKLSITKELQILTELVLSPLVSLQPI